MGLTRALVLAAALAAGVSYMAAWPVELPAWAETAWKGSGVGLLAVYAALCARDADGWRLAAVMGFGALGDVLLETHGLTVGAVAFLAGHLVAIWLYLRNRRTGAGWWPMALVPLTCAAAWALPDDPALGGPAALYSAGLAAMAAAAWMSRFPRAWVATGALMFLVSDLLIFAREGPLAGQAWASYGVWILYFGGQALICVGCVRALAAEPTRVGATPRRAAAASPGSAR